MSDPARPADPSNGQPSSSEPKPPSPPPVPNLDDLSAVMPYAREAAWNPRGAKPGGGGSFSPAPAPVAPADLPAGFWAGVDYMLRHPAAVIEAIRQDHDLGRLSRAFLLIALLMAALYGAVMGATNLLQGAPVPLEAKFFQIAITAIKTPVLFLLTLVIVLPPIYVSNAFVGAQLLFRQMLALLLGSVAITVTTLASMATVAFFFALTSRSYDFIKLLHVLVFVYAGLMGLGHLIRSIRAVGPARTPQWLFLMWLALYMFVGTQLAWVLRPFVGSPDMTFQVFRPRTGNFYESVIHSVNRVIKDESAPR